MSQARPARSIADRPTDERPHPPSNLRRDWALLGRHWRLIKLLHQAETSRVYAARPVLSSPFREAQHVIKLLRKSAESRRDAVSAIQREVHVARQVSHPRIVSVIESHVTRPPYYAVFSRITGESVAALLHRTGRLSIPLALSVVRQMAEGLSTLHAAGWLHGDIKPANVIVDLSGRATLIDLAFARPVTRSSVAEAGGNADSPTGNPSGRELLAGSITYMPPEALSRVEQPTIASDIYSLGVTLFELLAGRPPFSATETAQLLFKHREERAPCLREIRPQVPSSVAALVRSMLAKQPFRRPLSALDVSQRLVRAEIETFSQRD
ncbi:MAG: serine/threonine protein kinase [Pirellulales bacterium]|nr:serine/threonine protein kinase [Pirellulales bacterium]